MRRFVSNIRVGFAGGGHGETIELIDTTVDQPSGGEILCSLCLQRHDGSLVERIIEAVVREEVSREFHERADPFGLLSLAVLNRDRLRFLEYGSTSGGDGGNRGGAAGEKTTAGESSRPI